MGAGHWRTDIRGHCVRVSAHVCMRVWAGALRAEQLSSWGLLMLAESHPDLLHSLPGAAVTEHHQLGLSNCNLYSHNSGGWKSEVKVLAGLDSSVASLLDVSSSLYLCLCPKFLAL